MNELSCKTVIVFGSACAGRDLLNAAAVPAAASFRNRRRDVGIAGSVMLDPPIIPRRGVGPGRLIDATLHTRAQAQLTCGRLCLSNACSCLQWYHDFTIPLQPNQGSCPR